MALIEGGAVTASSRLTTLTGGGSAHSKGSWVELISSTSQDIEWLEVQFDANDGPSSVLVDIGTGAASSEVVVVPDIAFFQKFAGSSQAHALTLPISIPSGTRVAARCQGSGASELVNVSIVGGGADSFGTCSNVDAIGEDSTLSKGTVVDAGGTANTKGSWVELEASTANEYNWVVVCINFNNNTSQQAADYLVDIGTGAASSETVLIPNIHQGTDAFEIGGKRFHCFQVNIPASTRVAARSQCDLTDVTDRLLDVMLLGCELTAPAGGGGTSSVVSYVG
jgi:hypothetical protein